MKVQEKSTVIVLLLAFAATINALPTNSDKKIRDEVEIVPLEHHNPFNQPVIDTGADFAGPFGFIENFQSLMNRMRQQMEDILKRIPFIRNNGTTSVEDGFPGALPVFPPIGDIDLGKGNTTSVTKVIDGHKVVINDTVYKKEDDFGGAYFKVRIIDVKPDSSEVTTESNAEEGTVSSTIAATSGSAERETVENSFENEISKSSETVNKGNRNNYEIETYDNVPIITSNQKVIIPIKNNDPQNNWNNLEDFNSIDETTVPTTMRQPRRRYDEVDLSRDTYVNDVAFNRGVAMNPDAEVFFVPEHLREKQQQYYYNRYNPR